MLTDEQLANKIKDETADCLDAEGSHGIADDLIIEQLKALGYTKTVEAWEAVPKWYS